MYRYFQLMPEENNTCPASFPSGKTNKFDKSSICRCTFNSKSKEFPPLSITSHYVEKESSNRFDFEKIDKQGEKIPRDSSMKKHHQLKEKKLSTEDFYQKELGGKVFTKRKTGNEEETLKKRESGTKTIPQIEINLEESKENGGKITNALEKTGNNLIHLHLKEASVQTDTGPKNCCDNLREEILNTLENLREQPPVRQTLNSPPNQRFLSNTPTFQTDNPTFPNSESSTFENRQLKVNSPKFTNLNTHASINDSPTIFPSPGNFVQRLEERKDCLCCGTELTLLSNETSKNSKDSEKFPNEEELKIRQSKENSNNPQIVDTSRPEFVNVLIEIGKYTRNLERQLAQMNETMRNRINETKAWNSRSENTQPVGSSTPKEANNDEGIFLSLSNYMGSEVPNFTFPSEAAPSEELVTNRIESAVKESERDNQQLILSPIGTSTPVVQKAKVTNSEKINPDDGKVSNQIPGPSSNSCGNSLSFIEGINKNKKIQTEDLDETQYKDFPRSKKK